jgi:hypothetical protein
MCIIDIIQWSAFEKRTNSYAAYRIRSSLCPTSSLLAKMKILPTIEKSSRVISYVPPSTGGTTFFPVPLVSSRVTAASVLPPRQHLLPRNRNFAVHSGNQSSRTPHGLGAAHRGAGDIDAAWRYDYNHLGYEDYQRYISDRQLNFELKTEVFRQG